MLAKNPGFAFVAILTLAVGIGSATVVFSAIKTILMNPLPMVQDQSRLVHISETAYARGHSDMGLGYEDFVDIRERMTSFEGVWTHSDRTIVITTTQTEPERLLGNEISEGAFGHLGLDPLHGRTFTAADHVFGAPHVAVLSYGVWQRRFGGDPHVVGRIVHLNGRPTTLVGVMPKGVVYPRSSDIWVPQRQDPSKNNMRGSYYLTGNAKLKRGVTLEQAQAEADQVMASLARQFPLTNDGIGLRIQSLSQQVAGDAQYLLMLLFGAVMFVFLISCLNVANLVLARTASRSREFALRQALGAERNRLIRQLLTESLLLAFLGGIGGLLVSLWGMDLVLALIPVETPFWLRFDVDASIFAFVLLLSGLSASIFGLAPAFRATQPSLIQEIKEGARTGTISTVRRSRLHHGLVVAEIAIALVLLVGAGLMMRSLLHLQKVKPGFDASHVFTFRTGFPLGLNPERNEVRRFFATLVDRLEALPGVESASATSVLPGVDMSFSAFLLDGMVEPIRRSEAAIAYHRLVMDGYFSAMKIPLLAGRYFDSRDGPGTPRVAIVDETFARDYFGSPQNAIGRRVRTIDQMDEPLVPIEIIGVVGNIRHRLDRSDQKPTCYVAHSQNPINFMSVVMRIKSDPESYAALAQSEVLKLNPDMPIYYAFSLDQVLLQTVWTRQFFSHLFSLFAAIALFLACIGIYGVMSYSVSQRTQEIGVRMALGAQPREVISMVVRQGFRLIFLGLVSGLVCAAVAVQFFAGYLYGVSPHDPPTFILVPLALAVIALVACYLPSRRATRIDPMVALRAE